MKQNFKQVWSIAQCLGLTVLLIAGCSKNKSEIKPDETTQINNGTSNLVFYADTFKVYSTDLKGGNRKELINEDLKSENNYISSLSIAPGTSKIVYEYLTGYLDPVSIKVTNPDGSGKKTLKIFPAGINVNFVKAIAGDRIYFGTSVTTGGAQVRKFYVMNIDGTNEKELKSLSPFANINSGQVSSEGKGLVTGDGYFVKINNDDFAEINSYNVLGNENKANIQSNLMMSADAKKIAFISRTSSPDKYEIRVKDISTRNTASIVALNYTLPTTGPGAIQFPSFGLCWVDGNQKLLLSYGKMTFPKGSPNDYVFCQLLDVAKADISSWSFTGDGSLSIQAN